MYSKTVIQFALLKSISKSVYFSFILFINSCLVIVTSDLYCEYASSPAVETDCKYGYPLPPQTFKVVSVFPPLFEWKNALIGFPS